MNVQKSLEKAQEKLNQIQAAMALAETLPEFEVGNLGIYENQVALFLPYDICLYRAFRRLLGREWKQTDEPQVMQHSDNSVTRTFRLAPRNSEYKNSWEGPILKVMLDTSKEGSICQVKQVGVKEVPILEVTCG